MTSFFIAIILIIINTNGYLFLHQHLIDVRATCLSNVSRNLFLPSGGGEINSLIIYLSTKTIQPKCQFNIFSYLYDVGLIVVIEFLGNDIKCLPGEIILKDENNTNVCGKIDDNLFQYEKTVKNITVLFNFKKISSTYDIKLLVTAASLLSSNLSKCEEMGKILCVLGNYSLCIHKSLECNGDYNCGKRAEFDENKNICKALGLKIWFIVICTILLIAFSNFTIFHFINNIINPTSKYYYTVDESIMDDRKIKPQVKICHSEEHQTLSLTNQLYMTKTPVSVCGNSFNDKKVIDLPIVMRSSTLSPYTDLTSSYTSSKELDCRRSRQFKNSSGYTSGSLHPKNSFSQQIKHKMMSSSEATNSDGIKVTYYET